MRSFLLTLCLLSVALFSKAQTHEVTSSDDDGAGTLRDAITNATPGDTITFSSTINGDTIKLDSEIGIDKDLVIIGNDSTNTILDGQRSNRIFTISTTESKVTLKNMKLVNGFSSGNGGAIFFNGEQLSMSKVVITASKANNGGAVYLQGATYADEADIEVSERYQLEDCYFWQDTATNKGGAIYLKINGYINKSTFSQNSATDGGGVFIEDYYTIIASSTIRNSTFYKNVASSKGGGIYTGYFNLAIVVNSCTISQNMAAEGGGIYNDGSLAIRNAIIYNSIGEDVYDNSSTTAANNSIIGSCDNCTITPQITDDPIFGDFGYHSGFAPTIEIAINSPAIDAGKSSSCSSTDQRGVSRFGTCDIGSYEFSYSLDSLVVSVTPDDITGSLRDIVSVASSGDTVWFSAGIDGQAITLTSGQIVLNKDLTFIGNDTTNTIIDGLESSRIFRIESNINTYISGIKMQNGYDSGEGGAISNSGILNVDACAFVADTCNNTGGAIYNDDSLIVTNSFFTNNYAGHSGGGIYSDSSLTVRSSVFSENEAYNGGGAIAAEDQTLFSVSHSKFLSNYSDFGGAILTAGGPLAIDSSYFEDNLGNYVGGAIYAIDAELNIDSTTFFNNAAFEGGGAILTENCSCSSTILSEITRSVFKENYVAEDGGAILVSQELEIYNSEFIDNYADDDGGAIYSELASVLMDSVTFEKNTAEDKGGAIYNDDDAEIYIYNSSFEADSAYLGGAVQNYGGFYGDTLTFSYNYAETHGGGISNYSPDADLAINNALFYNNTAEEHGGGLDNNGGTALVIFSEFRGNTAEYGGGISSNESLIMNNTLVSGNTASEEGGGIYIAEGNTTINYGTIVNNLAKNGGGLAMPEFGSDPPALFDPEMYLIKTIIAQNYVSGGSGPDIYYDSGVINYQDMAIGNNETASLVFGEDGSLVGSSSSPVIFPFYQTVAQAGLPSTDGDYHLLYCSPTIDAGGGGAINDTLDLDGNERPYNTIPDIGVYEYQGLIPSLSVQSTVDITDCDSYDGIIHFVAVNVPDGDHELIYKFNGVADTSIVAVASETFSLTGLPPGSYSDFSLDVPVCTSVSSASPVVLNQTGISISFSSKTDPTACLIEDGTIDFSVTGFGDEEAVITYTHNSSWVTDTVDISSNSFSVGSLPGGLYETITISKGYCLDTALQDVTLTYPAFNITQQPAAVTICPGNETFLLVETDAPSAQYLWEVDMGSGFAPVSGTVYSGQYSSTLSLSNVPQSYDGYEYRCTVTNDCGSQTSDAATLTVDTDIVILSQPTAREVCHGETARFTAKAVKTSPGSISYQWQRKSGSAWVNISNGSIYTIDDSLLIVNNAQGSATFRCLMNDYCQTIPKSMTVIPVAQVTSNPADQTICVGNNAYFSVNATGTGLSFRWQVNTGSGFVNLTDGGVYQGTTDNSLSLLNPDASLDGYSYRCLVSGTGICDLKADTSEAALLNIGVSAEAQIIYWNSDITSAEPVSQAVSYILGINTITAPDGQAEYRAGNAILLNPGFEAEAGALFTAKIMNPCQNVSVTGAEGKIPKEKVK